MKIKTHELLIQLIFSSSTIMVAFTGELGINTTKYCLFFIVALCAVQLVFIRIPPNQIIPLMVTAVASAFTWLLYGGNPANLLIFVLSLSFAVTVFARGITEPTWKLIKLCVCVTSIWFIWKYMRTDGVYLDDRLMMHFENPNMAGIALSAPIFYLIIMAVEAQRRLQRILYIVAATVLIIMLTRTENRGSIIAVIVFAVFAIILLVKKRKNRLASKAAYVVMKYIPLIAMLGYVFLYTVLPHDLEFLGKPFFSGRESLWQQVLKQIVANPFSQNSYRGGGLNIFLAGAANYGIVAMIGYIWLLNGFAKKSIYDLPERNYLAYLGFHLCLFQQSFESTMISGSYSVYIWSYMLLGVASMEPPGNNTRLSGRNL